MTTRIIFAFFLLQSPVLSQGTLTKAKSEAAIELAEQADLLVEFDPREKTFDIRIGKVNSSNGARKPIRFRLEELEEFFNSQRHKNHIVIIFEKRAVRFEEQQKTAEDLKNYFVDRGFQRITIQQYFSSGRATYLDHHQKELK